LLSAEASGLLHSLVPRSLILSGFWCMLAILGGIQDGAVTPGFAFRPA
jgi:hypothetical protein